MNRGNKLKAILYSDGKTPDWKDLLNKIDSGIDRCSEHPLNMHRGQPSGPGDLSVFSLFSSSNTIEAVIIISSNLGTETSDSSNGKLAKFSSVKTLAKYEFNNSTFS